jgi:hypothetical protein
MDVRIKKAINKSVEKAVAVQSHRAIKTVAKRTVNQLIKVEVRRAVQAAVEKAVDARMIEVLADVAALRAKFNTEGTVKVSGALSPEKVQGLLVDILDPIRGVRQVGRHWVCVACEHKFDTARSASAHTRHCQAASKRPQQRRHVVEREASKKRVARS